MVTSPWRTREGVVLAVLCAAQFVLIVDVVVVNIAMPSIQSELRVPVEALQLAGVAYTVTFGSLLIVAGRAGDLYGRRKVLLAGLAVFTVMSGLCGLAQDDWQLFAARAAQGIGAAMVSPNAMALLVGTFQEGDLRNRALGIWAAVSSAGAMAGQMLGGVITELISWRGIFLINVPLGVIATVIALRVLPTLRPERAAPLDLWGAVLLVVGIGGASLLLADVGGDNTGLVVSAVVGLVIVFVALAMVERRHSDPIIPGGLIRRRNVSVANLVLMLNAGATTAALYFTTLTMQNGMGYGALETGLGFAPITGIVLLVSPRAGALVEKLGARTLLIMGSASSAVGLLVLSLVAAHSDSYWTGILPGLALVALGNGLSYAPTYSLATAVPDSEQGGASGLINTAQELGSASGLAILAAIAALAASAAASAGDFSAGYLAAAGAAVLAAAFTFGLPSKPAETAKEPAA